MAQTSLTISEALKDHLRVVAGKTDGSDGVDGVQTLHTALLHILECPYDEQISIDGYEETLSDPVKVSTDTLDDLRALRDQTGARDYEQAIRERANIEPRDVGEEPIELTNW